MHSMQLGPKISGVKLTFSSAWGRGYSLNYTLWCTDVIKCKFGQTVRLIFAPQVYANFQHWRTPEELLASLQCEISMGWTLDGR